MPGLTHGQTWGALVRLAHGHAPSCTRRPAHCAPAPPGQGRVAEAAPLLAGAAHALQATLGAAGAAPAGEARFYEALAVAGYGVRGGADADAAEAAMAEARGPRARQPGRPRAATESRRVRPARVGKGAVRCCQRWQAIPDVAAATWRVKRVHAARAVKDSSAPAWRHCLDRMHAPPLHACLALTPKGRGAAEALHSAELSAK